MTEHFIGEKPLRKWLTSKGFSVVHDPLRSSHNECNWYAYRRSQIEARPCECNEKPYAQIRITPYASTLPDGRHVRSATAGITGEAGGNWYQLDCYSLDPSEVSLRLDSVEAALVRAWNALLDGQAVRP